jgi:2-polyprenyl-3-methyl-5-hydroxy-6-metoxy-1,4-benzoquinol methylase
MKKCKICGSKNLKFISQFKPYIDKDWEFPIYDCLKCHSRFAIKDRRINYYELLHTSQNSSYSYHYKIAKKVSFFIKNNMLNKCEIYLRKASYKYAIIIDYFNNLQNEQLETAPYNGQILEIGCSTGFLTAFLKAKGFKIIGIDISRKAIQTAKTSFGNGYFLEIEDNKKFDIIFHTGLIGCIDEPKQFFNNYLKLLNYKGTMILNAPNVNSLKMLNDIWVSTPPPDLIYIYSKDSFKYLINKKFSVSISNYIYSYELYRKLFCVFMNHEYSTYPTFFKIRKIINNKKNIKTIFKNKIDALFTKIISILVYMKIIKHFESEFGLIIKIRLLND